MKSNFQLFFIWKIKAVFMLLKAKKKPLISKDDFYEALKMSFFRSTGKTDVYCWINLLTFSKPLFKQALPSQLTLEMNERQKK